MFGSQALETAIGLALLFFVMATAASATVEAVSRLLHRRADDLERGLAALLAGEAADEAKGLEALNAFKGTTVYTSAMRASAAGRLKWRQAKPTYLSAKSFADGVTEMLFDDDGTVNQLPDNLKARLVPLLREAKGNTLEVKAGLERWFDDAMTHVEATYKRWATSFLFVFGLGLAVAGNVSTIDVAQQLWQDPVTRQAVVDSATQVANNNGTDNLADVSASVDGLEQLEMPIGYRGCDAGAVEPCTAFRWSHFDWRTWSQAFGGWLLTALMLMLGAPFWFDLLSRLVSLRTAGSKPPPASQDHASATSLLRADAERAPAAFVAAAPSEDADGFATKDLDQKLRATFGVSLTG